MEKTHFCSMITGVSFGGLANLGTYMATLGFLTAWWPHSSKKEHSKSVDSTYKCFSVLSFITLVDISLAKAIYLAEPRVTMGGTKQEYEH